METEVGVPYQRLPKCIYRSRTKWPTIFPSGIESRSDTAEHTLECIDEQVCHGALEEIANLKWEVDEEADGGFEGMVYIKPVESQLLWTSL